MVASIHFTVYLTVIRLDVVRAENIVNTELKSFLII